jgi:hypothetical protein
VASQTGIPDDHLALALKEAYLAAGEVFYMGNQGRAEAGSVVFGPDRGFLEGGSFGRS